MYISEIMFNLMINHLNNDEKLNKNININRIDYDDTYTKFDIHCILKYNEKSIQFYSTVDGEYDKLLERMNQIYDIFNKVTEKLNKNISLDNINEYSGEFNYRGTFYYGEEHIIFKDDDIDEKILQQIDQEINQTYNSFNEFVNMIKFKLNTPIVNFEFKYNDKKYILRIICHDSYVIEHCSVINNVYESHIIYDSQDFNKIDEILKLNFPDIYHEVGKVTKSAY